MKVELVEARWLQKVPKKPDDPNMVIILWLKVTPKFSPRDNIKTHYYQLIELFNKVAQQIEQIVKQKINEINSGKIL